MDTASLYIGLVLLGIFTGPTAYAIWQTKNKEKKDLMAFNTFARANGLFISQTESINSAIIGIDTENRKLLYFSSTDDAMTTRMIDLRGLLSCKVDETASTVREGKGKSRKVVLSISLRFDFLGRPAEHLQLFDSQKTLWPDGEGPFAEKWSRIINEQLVLSTTYVARRLEQVEAA